MPMDRLRYIQEQLIKVGKLSKAFNVEKMLDISVRKKALELMRNSDCPCFIACGKTAVEVKSQMTTKFYPCSYVLLLRRSRFPTFARKRAGIRAQLESADFKVQTPNLE